MINNTTELFHWNTQVYSGLKWEETNISIENCGSRFKLELPGVLKITFKPNCSKETVVFDAQSIFPNAPVSSFSLPFESGHYYFQTKTQTFLMEITEKKSPYSVLSQFLVSKSFYFSLALHLIIFASIKLKHLGLFNFITTDNSLTTETLEPEKINEESSTPVEMVQNNRVPFQGKSLWFHLKNIKDNSEEGVAELLDTEMEKSLAVDPTKNTNSKPQVSSGSNNGRGFHLSANTMNTVITGNLSATKKTNSPVIDENTKKELSQAENQLRAQFNKMEPEFRNLYDQALLKDPTLNFHMVLMAKVGAQGSLSDFVFQITGSETSQQTVIAEFKKNLIHLLSQIKASRLLSGHQIRREFVFWR